jgi:hypothetical protein
MRHIKTTDLEVPDGWHDDAAKALAAVALLEGAERKKRNEEMDRHANKTWRALKDALMKLSHDKCWYCEIRQDRSLGAVDHYRPKGRVDGVPDHPGYWWLAFDENNYRFTCTLCNSSTMDKKTKTVGGKREQFPLFDEDKRANTRSSSLSDEKPKLLDPLIAVDPGLLTWLVDGNPAPRYPASQNAEWNERAAVSITVYHLNHYKLRRRRIAIYNELKLLIQEGDILYDKAVTNKPFERVSMERVTNRIMEILSESAELTATAKQYIREYRSRDSEREWLEGVINAA